MSEEKSKRFRPPEQDLSDDFLAEDEVDEVSEDSPESQRKKSQKQINN